MILLATALAPKNLCPPNNFVPEHAESPDVAPPTTQPLIINQNITIGICEVVTSE
jgi:hypothetical protein